MANYCKTFHARHLLRPKQVNNETAATEAELEETQSDGSSVPAISKK
jgi:hypothetical protein